MSAARNLSWSGVSLVAAVLASPLAGAIPSGDPAGTQAAPEAALVLVIVNGVQEAEPRMLLKSPNGAFFAPEEAIAAWRLKLAQPAFERDGTRYFALSAVQGLKLDYDEAGQILRVTASPDRIRSSRLAYRPAELGPMTKSGTGAFLNYDLVAALYDGVPDLGGQVEAGVFTPHGVGVTSFVGRAGGGTAHLTRLETSWVFDDPARMRSVRIGDGITRGGVGGVPVRFGGIQFGRNFAVEPGFVTLPIPTVRGSAAVPSVVDVYVNNTLRDSHNVQPGPFEIANVPIFTGSGYVQLVVRDLLGRETVVTQSYYAAPRLLRRGLYDYSFELGFLRRDFGQRSNAYGDLLFSTTQRYGLSDAVTGEAHFEATAKVQAAGLGADVAIAGVGAIGASVAASRSDRGTGTQVSVAFDRRTPRLSYGVHAVLMSDDYVSAGSPPDRKPPAATVQAFVAAPFRFGTLGLSYLLRDGRGEPEAEILSATASVRLGRVGTLYLAGRKNFRGPKDVAAELLLILPLGPRTSGTTGLQLRDDSASLTALIQRALPLGPGWGYRAAASLGATNRLDGRLSLQTAIGAYDLELTWVDGATGVRMTASGGVGIVDGTLFASRRLDESFAAVRVGDYAGVRVYADNQLVATTNRNGVAVIPRLRPYDRNAIRLETADLPLDAEVPSVERSVRPYDRSGVAVDFGVKPARAAMAAIVLEDGTSLPSGATVRLDGRPDEFVSAPGGEVYLTGLGDTDSGVAAWNGGTCRFSLRYSKGSDVQPRLDGIVCRRAG
ncbi:MAG: outer rane usher protein [Sphingomonadales bacterium]|nr:outer rane usher protein [Sphingomonadales bacterium]